MGIHGGLWRSVMVVALAMLLPGCGLRLGDARPTPKKVVYGGKGQVVPGPRSPMTDGQVRELTDRVRGMCLNAPKVEGAAVVIIPDARVTAVCGLRMGTGAEGAPDGLRRRIRALRYVDECVLRTDPESYTAIERIDRGLAAGKPLGVFNGELASVMEGGE